MDAEEFRRLQAERAKKEGYPVPPPVSQERKDLEAEKRQGKRLAEKRRRNTPVPRGR